VIFGGSSGYQSPGFLHKHDRNPFITGGKLSAAQDSGVHGAGNFDYIKRTLVQTHGILMLIAWPLLASVGVFFAAGIRPVLPNGEWFQVHRAFMIASLLVAAAGFVLIFFSEIRSNVPGLTDLGTGSTLQVSSSL
jgi:hypothetical protein